MLFVSSTDALRARRHVQRSGSDAGPVTDFSRFAHDVSVRVTPGLIERITTDIEGTCAAIGETKGRRCPRSQLNGCRRLHPLTCLINNALPSLHTSARTKSSTAFKNCIVNETFCGASTVDPESGWTSGMVTEGTGFIPHLLNLGKVRCIRS